MTGWQITGWFTILFTGAGLFGLGLYLRERYHWAWFIITLGIAMLIAFSIFGPDML